VSASGGIPARDSMLAPLQVGSRLLPEPSTPVKAAVHLAAAVPTALRKARALLTPRPERRAPAAPLSGVRPSANGHAALTSPSARS
jgi:hypothetical protein